jgi:hypothetical protein
MAQSWPPFEVLSSLQKLQALRSLVEEPQDEQGKTLPSEVIGWLSRLLIVRACGHLEQVVRVCARAYVDAKSGGPVRFFGLSWLEKSKNPSQSALEEFLTRFDEGWCTEFTNLLTVDDERLHRDLASAIDKRNRIAHGENEGASREQALRLCGAIVEITDWWTVRFKP